MTADTTQQRLRWLDVFRGLAIASTVLVNNPGKPAHRTVMRRCDTVREAAGRQQDCYQGLAKLQ